MYCIPAPANTLLPGPSDRVPGEPAGLVRALLPGLGGRGGAGRGGHLPALTCHLVTSRALLYCGSDDAHVHSLGAHIDVDCEVGHLDQVLVVVDAVHVVVAVEPVLYTRTLYCVSSLWKLNICIYRQ